MLANYLPIVIFIGIALLLGAILLVAGFVLSQKKPNAAKLAPYECGFDAMENARLPFDVRFYLVAILFIIFDLETAFLFPWAVVLRHLSWFGVASMGLFLGLLVLGFIYEWKKGALEWE
ncbi:MAG: NADH-quinone oxidoreductase subunit [Gammaproteobacteria bacterium]|jgi:NADH-quinone oxidoreductase subunit A|nr:NADH-quinone oxidoreductase subunit [Gammaproteobacteria bacterium]